jgi:hypothetical protein
VRQILGLQEFPSDRLHAYRAHRQQTGRAHRHREQAPQAVGPLVTEDLALVGIADRDLVTELPLVLADPLDPADVAAGRVDSRT